MANQKLEQIIVWLEGKLNTVADFDKVEYTDDNQSPPVVKDYGAHMYRTPGEDYEEERVHIGNHLKEFWSINTDIIINRHFQSPRKSVSDAKGISYWLDTIKTLLNEGSNSGVFDSSRWIYDDYIKDTDMYTLKGRFTCELVNTY